MTTTKLITRKDYSESKSIITYAVLNKDNVILSGGFKTKEEALDFKENAFCGYYNDCFVKPVYRKLKH